jgi:transcriptional regulator with XRE-family HTH domain
VFEREILPAIQDLSLSQLAHATGLSAGYLSQIKRGRIPHPRHWSVLRAIAYQTEASSDVL